MLRVASVQAASPYHIEVKPGDTTVPEGAIRRLPPLVDIRIQRRGPDGASQLRRASSNLYRSRAMTMGYAKGPCSSDRADVVSGRRRRSAVKCILQVVAFSCVSGWKSVHSRPLTVLEPQRR